MRTAPDVRARRVAAGKKAVETAKERAVAKRVKDDVFRRLLLYRVIDLQRSAAHVLTLTADRPALSLSRVAAEREAEIKCEMAADLRGLLERYSPQTIAGMAV